MVVPIQGFFCALPSRWAHEREEDQASASRMGIMTSSKVCTRACTPPWEESSFGEAPRGFWRKSERLAWIGCRWSDQSRTEARTLCTLARLVWDIVIKAAARADGHTKKLGEKVLFGRSEARSGLVRPALQKSASSFRLRVTSLGAAIISPYYGDGRGDLSQLIIPIEPKWGRPLL